MVQTVQLDENRHAVAMLRGLKQSQQDREHCDFIIKVQGREVHAHKIVLSLGSPYFKAMLKHDTKEVQDGKVEMREVDSECVETCIDFMYTSCFDIPDGKIGDLLHVAIMMQLDDVKEAICNILKNSLDAENFYETRVIANLYDLSVITEECRQFREANFMKLSCQPGFRNERKSHLIGILKTNKFSQEQKLDLSLKWVGEDTERKNDIVELIKLINLKEVSSEYLSDLLENHPVISNDFMLYKLLNAPLVESAKVSTTKNDDVKRGVACNQSCDTPSYGQKQKWKAIDSSEIVVPSQPSSHPSSASDGTRNPWHYTTSYGQIPRASGIQYQSPCRDESPDQRYERSSDHSYNKRGTNVALSKALVTLLRHKKPHNIPIDEAGYASVNSILMHPQFRKFHSSERDVCDIVTNDTKDRFETKGSVGNHFQIRATHGHSFKLDLEESGLELITDPKQYPVIVHGTYQKNWRSIKTQGLKRMTRAHLHFAVGYIGETHVTSGMRNTCDIVIIIDIEKAMADGLEFYCAKNKVVLCEGDRYGVMSPKYFKTVKKYDHKVDQFKDINFVFEG